MLFFLFNYKTKIHVYLKRINYLHQKIKTSLYLYQQSKVAFKGQKSIKHQSRKTQNACIPVSLVHLGYLAHYHQLVHPRFHRLKPPLPLQL